MMIFIELFLLRKIRISKRDSCASKNSSKNIVITTKATSVGFQCMVHAWCTHGSRSRAGDAHWGIRSCTICPILCIIFLMTTINHCFGYISIKNVILSNIYHAYECFELLRINR